MPLGELIEVGITYPVAPGIEFQRKDRNLAHVEERGHIVVVNLQRERVHDVLCVVKSNDLVLATARDLPRFHHLKNGIEAIGLGCRTGTTRYRFVDARREAGEFIHAAVRLFVIGVNSDKDVVAFVDENLPGIVGHAVDDSALHPGRDKNGDELFRFVFELFERDRPGIAVATQVAQELHIKEDIIDPKNEESDG